MFKNYLTSHYLSSIKPNVKPKVSQTKISAMKIFSIFIVFSVLFVNVLRCETLVNTNITETVFRVLESVKANQQAISPAEIDDNYNDGICVNQLVNFVLALSQGEWWAVQGTPQLFFIYFFETISITFTYFTLFAYFSHRCMGQTAIRHIIW